MPLPLLAAVPAISEVVGGILDRVWPKKMTEEERAQFEIELAKIDWQNVLGQLEINKIEAANESLFVSGWRPFIGWVCGSAFAWAFIVGPFTAWSLAVAGVDVPPLPVVDMANFSPVLMGMLGFGAYRTYEKVQDANKRR